jgi:WD40 repeat protein
MCLKLITLDLLASGANDMTIKLWNFTNGTLIRTLTGHASALFYTLDFLYDSQSSVVSGSFDQTIKFWNYSTGDCLRTINTGVLQARALAVLDVKLTSEEIVFVLL